MIKSYRINRKITPNFSLVNICHILSKLYIFFSVFLSLTTANSFAEELKLTPEEVIWLNANKNNISYAPNPSWPPGDYMENGIHKGIVSDYIRIFEEKLGIQFKKIYYNDWEHLYSGLINGEYDFIGACQKTDEREKFLTFTEPFLTTRLAVMTQANNSSLDSLESINSMTIAGIRGYSSVDYVKEKYPGVKIVECDDDLTVLLKVSARAVDGAIVDYMMASYLIDKYSITNIKYAMELDFHWDLRFAIQKNKPQLRSILDKVLRTISPEERQKIYHNWVTIKLEHQPSFWENNLELIAGIFLFILCSLVVLMIFNRSLQKQVYIRTRELKMAADELQENKEYLQALQYSAGDAIIVADADSGKIIDANHLTGELLGYTFSEGMEICIGDLSFGAPPYSTDDALKWLQKAHTASPQIFEWQAQHKDGYTIWVEVKINFAVIGEAQRFVIVIRDITRRKKIEEQLLKTQKLEALGVLAGGIAHDFNNLLFSIYGNIDLASDYIKDKKVLKYLTISADSIERAQALTHQLLTFSKGGEPIQRISPLFPFIQETVNFALSGSNISSSFVIPKELWNCFFDRNQISQVIDNLIINAKQAMPDGGKIKITASNISFSPHEHPLLNAGDYIKLSVEDTGPGIPKDLQSKIFDPFFTTKENGHGLGLATTFSIVKRHNGCIDIYSEPGKGSIFHVYLPAVKETAIPDEKKIPERYHGSGVILIMDDEPVVLNTIKDMLTSIGFSVICTQNGKEAVEILTTELKAENSIIAAIFDLTVSGGIGGKEAISKIRKMNISIPVFVASGYADDPVLKKPQEYGFTASISKPFRIAELTRVLEAHIKKTPSETQTEIS